MDCPQRQVNRIVKKKASTRSSIICHIKCLVSNKTYQMYQKKGQISETKREEKSQQKQTHKWISTLKISGINIKRTCIKMFKI